MPVRARLCCLYLCGWHLCLCHTRVCGTRACDACARGTHAGGRLRGSHLWRSRRWRPGGPRICAGAPVMHPQDVCPESLRPENLRPENLRPENLRPGNSCPQGPCGQAPPAPCRLRVGPVPCACWAYGLPPWPVFAGWRGLFLSVPANGPAAAGQGAPAAVHAVPRNAALLQYTQQIAQTTRERRTEPMPCCGHYRAARPGRGTPRARGYCRAGATAKRPPRPGLQPDKQDAGGSLGP